MNYVDTPSIAVRYEPKKILALQDKAIHELWKEIRELKDTMLDNSTPFSIVDLREPIEM